MAIRMLDVTAQLAPIQDQLEAAAARVLRKGQFILGEEVEALENEVARYCGVRYGVGVASGTDALLLGLAALGIGRGDEVITTPFTYVATVQAITHLGARPVFCDIDPQTFNLNPDHVRRAISRRTKAIIPVHLFGQCADMDPICDLAARRGIGVIEDSAQAIGATYHGRGACSLGHMGCLSFYPTKNLGACGDGGMILTNDEAIYQQLKLLRVHGRADGYYYLIDGFNSRLDEIQAAFLRIKMSRLAEYTSQRQQIAAQYNELLAGIPQLRTPFVAEHNQHVYHQYCIIAEQRDELREFLKTHGVDSAVYYPLPLHQQDIYRQFKRSMPVAEATCKNILALPIAPECLGTDGTRTVAEVIKAFYKR